MATGRSRSTVHMLLTNLSRTIQGSAKTQLVAYVIAAAGSVWLLSKLLRALASYAFPNVLPGEPITAILASPRPKSSQPVSAKDFDHAIEYDYIIVGTGTAGCVIANRLSEDPNVTVLAIESGHSDLKQIFSRIPAGFGRLFRTAADHDLYTTPQKNAGGRGMQWPRGKMLGGCSSINAMIFNKGAPDDYDEWQRLGNVGWGFKDVEPFMKKAECFNPSPKYQLAKDELEQHGRSGPWQIGYSHQSQMTPHFLDACAENGIPKVQDINSEKGINGVTALQTFIDSKGQRSSAAVAYLTKDVASRSNLKIATGQTVTKVIFDDSGLKPRAVGVEMAANSTTPVRYLAKAKREVILCAGAVHTPHILKLSGIGSAKELSWHGIKLIKELPAVGANLVDHIFSPVICKVTKGLSIQYADNDIASLPALLEWLRYGTGIMTTNVCESAGFLRTAVMDDAPTSLRNNDLSSGKNSADLEILMSPLAVREHGRIKVKENIDLTSIGPVMLRPESRGTIKLASSDPFTQPVIDANYLATQHDVDVMLYGTKLSMKISRSMEAFQGWYWPSKDLDSATDDQLIEQIRNTCETLYHPMCTAKMGSSAGDSVVDAQLKVHGVDGLRIADASIFPTPLACHPCAPVIMIGEKAADIIKRSS